MDRRILFNEGHSYLIPDEASVRIDGPWLTVRIESDGGAKVTESVFSASAVREFRFEGPAWAGGPWT